MVSGAIAGGNGNEGGGATTTDSQRDALDPSDSQVNETINDPRPSKGGDGGGVCGRLPGSRGGTDDEIGPESENSRLEEEAAVGSIHHILKTAFKELYRVADKQQDVGKLPATSEKTGSLRPSSPTAEAAEATVEGEQSVSLVHARHTRLWYKSFFKNESTQDAWYGGSV